MYLKILKRDLKRKKTMNIILLIFIIIAATFVSSGVNNIIAVLNGTDHYLKKAGVGDYNLLSTSINDEEKNELSDILESCPQVKSFIADENFTCVSSDILINGNNLKSNQFIMVQPIHENKFSFYDKNNNELTDVPKGKIYSSYNFLDKNNIEIGDTLTISGKNGSMKFEVADCMKDALLGSTFMGGGRLLVNAEDYEKLHSLGISNGQITCIFTDDTDAVSNALNGFKAIQASFDYNNIKITFIMETLIAAIVLIMSICLIIVSFLILKFTISFTISEEFHEIGVMKAIGLKNSVIRRLYAVKYIAISVFASAVGLIASIPFSKFVLSISSKNMVLEGSEGCLTNILSTAAVLLIIILYTYKCTGKIKKLSPLDAIRNGQTGERFNKKSFYRISKSHLRPSGYMALNDILSAVKRYITIIISFTLCTLLVLTIVNTTETMQSDKLAYTFSKISDSYIFTNDDDSDVIETMNTGDMSILKNKSAAIKADIEKLGYPCDICADFFFTYSVTFNGQNYNINCQQGFNTKCSDYVYYKGTPPQNKNEIAITPVISEKLDAVIGDTFSIKIGENTEDYIITALYQTMNQAGECIRLHEDADIDATTITGGMSWQIDFKDNPSKAEIDKRNAEIRKLPFIQSVKNAEEFTADNIGVVDIMLTVKNILLAISLIVIVLVTILMERSFISDEKKQIALLKAIGFKNSSVAGWHVYRFGFIGVISTLIAAALSIPVTKLCITPVWKMMGMKTVEYQFTLYKILLVYPIIVLAATIIAAFATALYTRTVKSSDASNIE